MKKCFILIMVLLLGSRILADESVFSSSLIPKAQLAEIKSLVYAKAFKAVNRCHKGDVTEINVTSSSDALMKNRDGKVIAGGWSEEWTVNACGTNVVVPVVLHQNLSQYSKSRNRIYSNSYLKYEFAPVKFK